MKFSHLLTGFGFAVVVLGAAGAASAQQATYCAPGRALAAAPAEVVDRFIAAYNRRDIAGLRGLLTRNGLLVEFGGKVISNGAETVNTLESQTFKTLPDVQIAVVDRIVFHNVVTQTERATSSKFSPQTVLSTYRVNGGCIDRTEVVEPRN